MDNTASAQAGAIQVGMEVYGADGRQLGTVERVEHRALYAAGRRVTLDAVERIEAGQVHLWGDREAYTVENSDAEMTGQLERSEGLPHTDEPLYVNERDVERSLEERLPSDGRR